MSSRAATVLTVVFFLLFCYATAATLVGLSALARVESLEQQVATQQQQIRTQMRLDSVRPLTQEQNPFDSLIPDERVACDPFDINDEDCY